MLDVPRSDATVLDALDDVANIVVVANQELATVRNAGTHGRDACAQRYAQDQLSRRSSIAPIVVRRSVSEDVERAVGGTDRAPFPSDYRRALQAMNKGRPLALDNHNELSASFTAFARDLAGVETKKSERAARAGLTDCCPGDA